ncbi:hypothetical protein GW924_01835 [Candidatus Pacearchaeota archaeon]|nr:hypothetical protein [Candidatus Pacearchaeota archaeon]OIO42164.1 MAG: hypothetical protein AUJ64_04310 [Candidatus Pacearchaeota archaeon CG1_02_39_14]
MDSKKWWILSGVIVLIIVEIVLFVFNLTELVYYNSLLLIVMVLIFFLHRIFQLPEIYVFGLIVVGLLNLTGGLVFVEGIRLYDFYFGFVKLDMVIHAIGSFMAALIIYHIISTKFKKANKEVLLLLAALSAMGVGALFEVLELGGYIFLENNGVGDYLNNALDLFLNLVGILIASLWISFRK